MTNPRPVPITAASYDAALAFCNRRRAPAEPWVQLPAGRCKDSHSCPCAQAVPGMRVGYYYWAVERDIKQTLNAIDDEPGLRAFIDEFDVSGSPGEWLLPVRTP